MMGERTVMQEALFYSFGLKDHGPSDHLLRSIDRFVDLGDLREYLEVLDDAAFGGSTPVQPKRITLTDPASRWTAATREWAFYTYSTYYLIDLDHVVIVDVEAATSVRQAESAGGSSGRRSASASGPPSAVGRRCCSLPRT